MQRQIRIHARPPFLASVILVLLLVVLSLAGPVCYAAPTRVALVDPFIGAAGGGNTYPGAVAPFGMVQFSLDSRRPSIGYDYNDRRVLGFSMTDMSGVGCDDDGEVFIAASTGPQFVFTSMGFYPVDPGVPDFEMVSPIWKRATIRLPSPHTGRRFVVESDGNDYVSGAELNGRSLLGAWFPESALLSGGKLIVRSGPVPNRRWGASPTDRPPSVEP